MATGARPISRQVRATRTAISPRLAMRTLRIGTLPSCGSGAHSSSAGSGAQQEAGCRASASRLRDQNAMASLHIDQSSSRPASRGIKKMGMKEMRDAYVQTLEAQMKEWSAKLKEMKAKAEGAVAHGKIEYEHKLAEQRVE